MNRTEAFFDVKQKMQSRRCASNDDDNLKSTSHHNPFFDNNNNKMVILSINNPTMSSHKCTSFVHHEDDYIQHNSSHNHTDGTGDTGEKVDTSRKQLHSSLSSSSLSGEKKSLTEGNLLARIVQQSANQLTHQSEQIWERIKALRASRTSWSGWHGLPYFDNHGKTAQCETTPVSQDYTSSLGLSEYMEKVQVSTTRVDSYCASKNQVAHWDILFFAAQLVGSYRLHVYLLEELVHMRDETRSLQLEGGYEHVDYMTQPKLSRATHCLSMIKERCINSLKSSADTRTGETGSMHQEKTSEYIAVPPMACFSLNINQERLDDHTTTLQTLQEEIDVCQIVCEELYDTSFRAILHAKRNMASSFIHVEKENNNSRNNMVVKKQRKECATHYERVPSSEPINTITDRMLSDLELFRSMYIELKSTLKLPISSVISGQTHQCLIQQPRQQSCLSSNDVMANPPTTGYDRSLPTMPYSIVNWDRFFCNNTPTSSTVSIDESDSIQITTALPSKVSTNQLDDGMPKPQHIAKDAWAVVGRGMVIPNLVFLKKQPPPHRFICWISIHHNASRQFLSAVNGKVSLTPHFDLDDCLFGLHIRADSTCTNNTVPDILMQQQRNSKKRQRLNHWKTGKRVSNIGRATCDGGILGEFFQDKDDGEASSPSVVAESTAVVGFCHRSTEKWLGSKTILGFGGGVSCEGLEFARCEEWEVSINIFLVAIFSSSKMLIHNDIILCCTLARLMIFAAIILLFSMLAQIEEVEVLSKCNMHMRPQNYVLANVMVWLDKGQECGRLKSYETCLTRKETSEKWRHVYK